MLYFLYWMVLLFDEYVFCEKNMYMFFIWKIYIFCENINWCLINVVFFYMGRRKFEVDYMCELFFLKLGVWLFISYIIGEIDYFFFFLGVFEEMCYYIVKLYWFN